MDLEILRPQGGGPFLGTIDVGAKEPKNGWMAYVRKAYTFPTPPGEVGGPSWT